MDFLSTNEFNFNELDMETIDSVMQSQVDLFSSSYDGETYYNASDMIDEFLNLDQDKKNAGIFIEQQTPQNQIPLSEDELRQRNLSAIKSDHDYSCPTDFTTVAYEEKEAVSPTTLSDSGVSSDSSSPASDRSGSGSPSVQSPEFTNEVFSKHGGEQGFLNDDLLDLHDVDMEQCVNMKTDSPFHIDLSSLFTESTYDAPPAVSNSDIFGNDYSTPKPNSGYDGCCESSAESTTSREGVVAVNMENLSTKKSKLTVKENLPNFTPLVLSEEEMKLLSEEGVSLPTDLPLTRYEERVLKKVRRKIRNKKSAMASRQKKKDYVSGLEARVAQCTNLNQTLSQRVKQLEQQNMTLLEQLRQVHNLVKHTSGKTTQATTCVMVLLLSFGLFIAPNYGPLSATNGESELQVPEGHRSRKVLQHPTIQEVKNFNENLVMGPSPYVFKDKPIVKSHVTHDDKTLTVSMDLTDVSNKLAKHDNDSAQNASLRSSGEADVAVSMTTGVDKESQQHVVAAQQNAINTNQAKINIANGQLTTTVKLEPKADGGRHIKVAPPVVSITGSDEM